MSKLLSNKTIKFKLLSIILSGLLLIVVIGVPLTLLLVNNGFNSLITEECNTSMDGLQSYVKTMEEELEGLLKQATDSSQLPLLVMSGDGQNAAWAQVKALSPDGVLVLKGQTPIVQETISLDDVKGILSKVMAGETARDYVIVGDKLLLICGAPVKMNGTVIGAGFNCKDLGNEAIVDELKDLTGNDFTIFKNNIRYNTSIIAEGKRQVGTEMGAAIKTTVIDNKGDYQGRTTLFGSKYTVSYKPILNANEETVGAWFSGVNIDSIVQTEVLITAVIAAYLVVISVIIFFIMKKAVDIFIIRPLHSTLEVSKQLGEGNLGISSEFAYDEEDVSHDEIGEIFNSLISTQESMKTYIGEISKILSEMSEGNLNVQLEEDYIGDYIKIKDSLETIIVALSDAMRDIDDSAQQVAVGSNEVASGAKLLADGTIEQMDAVRNLSTSMENIAQKVQKNADDAKEANQVASGVNVKIEESSSYMSDMMQAIDEINVAANEIDNIIKTIDDIAFQTNILALNAAVEAARAGEAGKGFAVVADEVRNLAGKSAQAAKETTDLIQRAIEAIAKGTKISQKTSNALNSVVESTSNIVNSISSISLASEEQAEAVGTITDGVNQISNVIQTVSATAQESLAISKELSGQAENLKSSVSQFKIN
ncbi:MAG: cache domain-containing protein [Clostridiales bacterium]|nr:cache domain-containing protein [Clostridiales bacterium]